MTENASNAFSRKSEKKMLVFPKNAEKMLAQSRKAYTLSNSPIHLSFIHIYHFDTLSLAVWQDTYDTYKNVVYDLAYPESPIAQWLECPTGIWKVMGSTPFSGL